MDHSEANLPPTITDIPPKLAAGSSPWRKLAAIFLSVFLGVFTAGGLVPVLDDSCVLLFGTHLFTTISGILALLTLLLAIPAYGLMGLTPVIPKRIVVPPVALIVFSFLGMLPVTIYGYQWALPYDLMISCLMAALGLGLIFRLQGGGKLRWSLVPEKHLGTRAFSWVNLAVFVAVNLFMLLPLAVGYVGGCVSLAASHFTDGFVSLRPGGVFMQARKYTRDDGKTIVLFPMSHIAEADFYQSVMQSVSSNSVVLLEGVTDTNHLLKHRLTYQRAAKSLHLAEQHQDFQPSRGELVRADVDVQEFSSNTIAVLNVVALLHSEGLNVRTLSVLLESLPSETDEQQLLDDLLLKRNAHVIEVLRSRLPDANDFVIPWGAAHSAGLAREVEKLGFHLAETHDYVSIRFGGKKNGSEVGTNQGLENSH